MPNHFAPNSDPVAANGATGLVPVDFERLVRVQEHDLDRFGLAIPAMYARWMEETEYAFLRSRGLSVSLTDARGRYGFPRTRVHWEIFSPARREDELQIGLWLGETDGKRLHYRFEIVRRGKESPEAPMSECWERCAAGEFHLACCRFPPEAMPYAIPIPDSVLERLRLQPS
jgi:acyl-CoA thioesterase FadM